MRFNRRALVTIPLFVVALVLLRQGIVLVNARVPVLEQQARLMQQQDIDPAALFYTDSRVALRAVRDTSSRVNGD